MKRLIRFVAVTAAILAFAACADQKAKTEVAADGFDADFCEQVRNTAVNDIDTAMISRMVEQAKILKPMFEPGVKANFASEADSVARQQAYDDVSGKLYELLLEHRIDRVLIDQVNGYEAVPLPENDDSQE
ncbi:MAG: hypothetical protein IK120_08950 [Muribaculaceae bacterium]|nr:hypothetical protein [Muribaculaceae bacterium]